LNVNHAADRAVAAGRSGDRTVGPPEAPHIMIVCPGRRCSRWSGRSTARLAEAFAERHRTSELLIRGKAPVPGFVRLLRGRRPDVVVLPRWSAAAPYGQLLLAVLAARRGARVVLDWHQVPDAGEARTLGVDVRVAVWGEAVTRLLVRRCDGHVVHCDHAARLLRSRYDLNGPVQVVPYGPFDPVEDGDPAGATGTGTGTVGRQRSAFDAPDATSIRTVLSFGSGRPSQGVPELVSAFDSLPEQVASRLRLVIAGQTRRGRSAAAGAVAASPRHSQITVIDECLNQLQDADVSRLFRDADAVVLPHSGSSTWASLQIAMSAGLPVLMSDVGCLLEVAGEYAGIVSTRRDDVPDLARGLIDLLGRCGRRCPDPRSWKHTLDGYDRLLAALGVLPPRPEPAGRQTRLTADQLLSQVVALSSPTIAGALR
jgi:glycosyltransferase involved in cell wall biosynthesis